MFRRCFSRRLIKSKDGVTAVEFGLIAGPFFLLLMGIVEVSLVIFTTLVLENGVIEATRQIRTGEFQKTGGGMVEFKALLCESINVLIDCGEDLYIDVQTFANFGGATVSDPMETGTFGENFGFNAGGAQSVVLVRVFHMKKIHTPMIGEFLANAPDSKRITSWATAFETEPF